MAHTTFTVRVDRVMTPDEVAHASNLLNDLHGQVSVDIVEPKYNYKITQDQDAESPRSWDNVGVMHCGHSRYTLGDTGASTPFVDDDYRAGVLRDDIYLSLPIYMYDHSGLTISHTPFSCQWDSGLLGWHYVTHEAVKENWPSLKGVELRDVVERALAGELRVYDFFLCNEVWRYSIVDEDGDHVDSCGGFYGDTLEATMILSNVDDIHHEGLRQAWNDRSY